MEAFGASAEQLSELKASLQQKSFFAVWPENWHALQILGACQWQVVAGFSGLVWIGLDRNALPYVEARIKPTDGAPKPSDDVLFGQLQLAEQAALAVLNRAKS